MGEMTRLATFMQISDLHFGLLDPSSLNATNRWWMKLPILDGFLGHSEIAIRRLTQRYSGLKNSEDKNAYVVTTGDLTTCGKAQEFQLFDAYAGADPTAKALNHLGLRSPSWRKRAIPGNHDHWPGSIKIVGAPNAALYRLFPNLPRTSVLHTNGYQIRFIWIDSDIDVGFRSIHRGWARGSCVSHLEMMQNQLPAFADKEIRVLCMHHSPTFRGTARSLRSLELDGTSRRRVAKFIIDNRISVVLCGHVHNPPYVQTESAHIPGQHRLFLEARCGSTSQVNPSEMPIPLKSRLRTLKILPPERTNSVLIHRVTENNGQVTWETEINLLYTSGFAKPPSAKLQNNQDVTVPFTVWS